MNIKDSLKIGGLISFIMSAIYVLICVGYEGDIFLLIKAVLLIVIGVFFYQNSFKTDYEIKNKKNFYLIIGIIEILSSNIIMGVTSIVLSSKINNLKIDANAPPTSEEVSKEDKKLDILLKIGVGMVLLSGFVIATTRWNIMPDLVKTLLIVLLSLVFFALSFITSKYINVKSSRVTYFLLGMIFLWLAYFSLGYYGIIADLFVSDSSNAYLFFASCGLFAAILLYISKLIFKEEVLSVLIYITLITSVIILSKYFNLGMQIVILVLNMVCIMVALTTKKKIFADVSTIVSYLLMFILPFVFYDEHILFTLISIFINMILLFRPTDNNNFMILNGIFINYLIIFGLIGFDDRLFNIDFFNTVIMEVLLTLVIVNLLFNKIYTNEKFVKGTAFASSIFMLVIFGMLFSVDIKTFDLNGNTACIISSILILVTSIIYLLRDRKEYLDCSIVLVYPFLAVLLNKIIGLGMNYTWGILFVVNTILIYFVKVKYIKYLNIVLLMLAGFFFIGDTTIIGCILMSITTILYYMAFDIDDVGFKTYLYVVLHLVLFIAIASLLPLTIDMNSLTIDTLCTVIVLLSYIVSFVLCKSNKINSSISLIAILFPCIKLINLYEINNEISIILKSILAFYVVFIICSKVLSDEKNKRIFAIVACSFILLYSAFSEELLVALFAIIASLGLIVFDLKNDKYNGLNIVGIVFIVLNIMFQLREVLFQIDLWLYLLLIGLIIIGVVTYKQIKRK